MKVTSTTVATATPGPDSVFRTAVGGLSRRAALLVPLALMVVGGRDAAAALTLLTPASLQQELALALKVGRPLIVMVSLEGCPFCRIVRESYLRPLRTEEGQPVVQLDMQSGHAVRDFRGAVTTHDHLVRAWTVKVAPTVLFFGVGGSEVAPRLEGASIPDFYGAYLDERLRIARRALG